MRIIRMFFGFWWLAILGVSWRGIYAGLQASPNIVASILMLLFFVGIGVVLITGIPFLGSRKTTSTRVTRTPDEILVEGHKGKYPKKLWDKVEGVVNDFSWLEDNQYLGEIEVYIEGGEIVDVKRYYYDEDDFNERGFIHGTMSEKQ